jgi:hypothetical protein
MKRAFQKLIAISPCVIEQNEVSPSSKNGPIEDYEVFDEDNLRLARAKR